MEASPAKRTAESILKTTLDPKFKMGGEDLEVQLIPLVCGCMIMNADTPIVMCDKHKCTVVTLLLADDPQFGPSLVESFHTGKPPATSAEAKKERAIEDYLDGQTDPNFVWGSRRF